MITVQAVLGICVLLTALGLALYCDRHPRLAKILGAIIIVLGTLNLAFFALAYEPEFVKLSQFFPHPGGSNFYLAALYATDMILPPLYGLALVLLSSGDLNRGSLIGCLVGTMSVLCNLIAATIIVSNATFDEASVPWAVAIHLTIGAAFVLVSIRDAGWSFRLVRSWPYLNGALATTITLGMTMLLARASEQTTRAALHVRAEVMTAEISKNITVQIRELEREASRWDIVAKGRESDWRENAQRFRHDVPGFKALSWVDPDMVVRWIEPFKGNETALGFYLGKEDRRRAALERSRKTGNTETSEPVDLVQGGKGMLILVPIGAASSFGGYISAVLGLREWLGSKENISVWDGSIYLFSGDEVVYEQTTNNKQTDGYPPTDVAFSFNGVSLRLRIIPSDLYVLSMFNLTPLWAGLAGLLMALLLSFTSHAMIVERAVRKSLGIEILSRKAYAQSLQDTNETLRVSNLDLERFAFIASHDLQEPLRKVQTYSKMLRDSEGPNLGDTGKRHLARLIHNTDRMRDLIEDVLVLSSVNSANRILRDVDMQALIERVVASLKSDIVSSGATLTLQNLSYVVGDDTLLSQLFLNLITNSLKFSKNGEAPRITIHSRQIVTADDDADYCEVCVEDEGIGFDSTYAEKIFEPFTRLVGRETHGSGIGLAICHRIARHHNGTIRAQSEVGRGAKFFVTLPTSQKHKPESHDDE